jgi:hypothetical protein
MQTLNFKEIQGGIVPIDKMGDMGIEVKHTLQTIQIQQRGERLTGHINVMLVNNNENEIVTRKGEKIGGYRPQCIVTEDRYDLNSIEGMRLAAALRLEGTAFIRGLDVGSASLQKVKHSVGVDINACVGATEKSDPGLH